VKKEHNKLEVIIFGVGLEDTVNRQKYIQALCPTRIKEKYVSKDCVTFPVFT
jgi:hypothetical protein